MSDFHPGVIFEVFNEIGIIEQLTRTVLEARLPDGMIAPQFSVLNHLVRVGDGTTPVRIARAFQVPKTSMTHTLKALEERGLVEMQPNPEDGRSKQVWITPAGRQMRETVIAGLSMDFQAVFETFGLERFQEMRPQLQALRVFLDENRHLTGTGEVGG